jgi:hypothetical protein
MVLQKGWIYRYNMLLFICEIFSSPPLIRPDFRWIEIEYAPSQSHGIYWLVVFWNMYHLKVMVFIDWLYFGVCTISKSWWLWDGTYSKIQPVNKYHDFEMVHTPKYSQSINTMTEMVHIPKYIQPSQWYLLTGCILEYAPSQSHGIYWLAVFWSRSICTLAYKVFMTVISDLLVHEILPGHILLFM